MSKYKPSEFLDVDQLQEHPLQNELFDSASEKEITSLAEHYKNVGGRQTIYACADGTIIYGVRTVKASIEAGLFVVPTVVRDDLGTSNRPEVLLEMVRLFRLNEPMDSMTMGRCYKALKEILIGARRRLSHDDVTRIHLALGTPYSFETVEQLGRLAELPRFLHSMIVNEMISKKQAENIRLLDLKKKQSALAAIEQGDSIKDVARRFDLNRQKTKSPHQRRQNGYARTMTRPRSSKPNSRPDPFRTPGHLEKIAQQADADHQAWLDAKRRGHTYMPLPCAQPTRRLDITDCD